MLTPTRELCIQVTQALRAYGARKGVDVVAVFGGAPIRSQQAQLRAGGHIVVGTVGRVKDLISRHSLVLHDCRFVVLDEADEMLDLGFLEDVEKILALTPEQPPDGALLGDDAAGDPQALRALPLRPGAREGQERRRSRSTASSSSRSRRVGKEKDDALVRVLEAERPDQAIVFVRTKIRCDQLFRRLRDRGMNVKALHGDMTPGLARRRDARVQERAPADPRRDRRRRARARHLRRSRTSSTSTCRPRRTSTSTASAAPAASAARAARSPSTSRARSATSRRSSATPRRRCRRGRRARRSPR